MTITEIDFKRKLAEACWIGAQNIILRLAPEKIDMFEGRKKEIILSEKDNLMKLLNEEKNNDD